MIIINIITINTIIININIIIIKMYQIIFIISYTLPRAIRESITHRSFKSYGSWTWIPTIVSTVRATVTKW